MQLHIQVLHLKFRDLYRCAHMNSQRVSEPVASWLRSIGWAALLSRHETEADVEPERNHRVSSEQRAR